MILSFNLGLLCHPLHSNKLWLRSQLNSHPSTANIFINNNNCTLHRHYTPLLNLFCDILISNIISLIISTAGKFSKDLCLIWYTFQQSQEMTWFTSGNKQFQNGLWIFEQNVTSIIRITHDQFQNEIDGLWILEQNLTSIIKITRDPCYCVHFWKLFPVRLALTQNFTDEFCVYYSYKYKWPMWMGGYSDIFYCHWSQRVCFLIWSSKEILNYLLHCIQIDVTVL